MLVPKLPDNFLCFSDALKLYPQTSLEGQTGGSARGPLGEEDWGSRTEASRRDAPRVGKAAWEPQLDACPHRRRQQREPGPCPPWRPTWGGPCRLGRPLWPPSTSPLRPLSPQRQARPGHCRGLYFPSVTRNCDGGARPGGLLAPTESGKMFTDFTFSRRERQGPGEGPHLSLSLGCRMFPYGPPARKT